MKITKYFAVAAFAITMVSCSDTDDIAEKSPSEVEINFGISGETRVTPFGDAFEIADKVLVQAGTQKSFYTKQSGNQPWEAQKPMFWDTESMTFKAVFPSNASFDGFTIQTNQNENVYDYVSGMMVPQMFQMDYMLYEGVHKRTDGPVSIEMQRQTAWVCIVPTIDAAFFPEGNLPKIQSISVFAQTGIGNAPKNISEIQSYYLTDAYQCLVAPDAAHPEQTFIKAVLEYGDGSTKTLAYKGIPELKKGNRYTFNLIIGRDEMEIKNVTIKPWGDGGDSVLDADDVTPAIDVTTHTITTKAPTSITAEAITKALAGGKDLNIAGPINAMDAGVISEYSKNPAEGAYNIENLDLTKADMSRVTGFSKLKVRTFKIPDNAETISGHGLDSVKIEKIVLNENLKVLEEDGIQYSEIGSITIPESVNMIYTFAFFYSTVQELIVKVKSTIGQNFVIDAFQNPLSFQTLVLDDSWFGTEEGPQQNTHGIWIFKKGKFQTVKKLSEYNAEQQPQQ